MKGLLLKLIVLGLAVSAVLIPSASVSAQSASAASGLEISPALVEVKANKDNTYTIEIKVVNVTSSTLTFQSSIDDFGAKDESGSPSILLEPTAEPLPTSIKTWVSTIPSFTLAPGKEQKVQATITVPAGAQPGGHYGVIRFTGREGSEASENVGQVASAGTLVLINVDGVVKESLEIASFIPSVNDTPTFFFETGPILFVSRFTNTGSVHVKPVGQIEIKDMFGNPIASLPVNDAKGNVLPNSTRRFESQLDKTWMFGQYTADMTIAYGNTGQALVKTISFWVIPWKLVLVGLFVVVTLIYILRKAIKRYNTFIIEKDKQSRKK